MYVSQLSKHSQDIVMSELVKNGLAKDDILNALDSKLDDLNDVLSHKLINQLKGECN